jgi:hypothetical protein
MNERRCRLCKRVLQNPRSQYYGIGPECLKKERAQAMAAHWERRKSLYASEDATTRAGAGQEQDTPHQRRGIRVPLTRYDC